VTCSIQKVSWLISINSMQRRTWVPIATGIVALVFFSLPSEEPLRGFLPDWVSLVLIYWTFALPARMMVGMAWSAGLVVDIVSFGLPGVYALSKAVLVYLARVLALRVRTYPLWQQTIVVLGLLGIEMLILTLIDFMVSGDLTGLQRWTAVVVGALVWPAVYWILRRARHLARLGH